MRRAVPLCRGVLPGAFVLVRSLIAQAKHGWGQDKFVILYQSQYADLMTKTITPALAKEVEQSFRSEVVASGWLDADEQEYIFVNLSSDTPVLYWEDSSPFEWVHMDTFLEIIAKVEKKHNVCFEPEYSFALNIYPTNKGDR